jgi:hypothetical protein
MKRLAILALLVAVGSFLFATDKTGELKFGHYLVETYPAHIAARPSPTPSRRGPEALSR